MRRINLRLLLPISLLPLLVLLAVGCVYYPRQVNGPEVSKYVGPPDSNKPIHEGVARKQVITLLGKPWISSTNSLEYQWFETPGYWQNECSFGAAMPPMFQRHHARLEFDDNDRLKTIQID